VQELNLLVGKLVVKTRFKGEGGSVKMPFKSKKQRTYLRINNPKLFKKWQRKYGSKIRR